VDDEALRERKKKGTKRNNVNTKNKRIVEN
jgi:hypothetical protein